MKELTRSLERLSRFEEEFMTTVMPSNFEFQYTPSDGLAAVNDKLQQVILDYQYIADGRLSAHLQAKIEAANNQFS